MNIPVEIERKYIIRMPNASELESMPHYSRRSITQIYLETESPRITHRVRSSDEAGRLTYTETKKVRIDKISAYEDESEISKERFSELSKQMKTGTSPINKIRHTFVYFGQKIEIDIYPAWKNTAILETELKSREEAPPLPKFIKIVREVSGIGEYTNAGMARKFPAED